MQHAIPAWDISSLEMDFASLSVSETIGNLIAGFRHGTCSLEKLSRG